MSEEFPETPVSRAPKKKGAPVVRSARQKAASLKVAENNDLAVQRTKAKADAAQLAQIVNLIIAGHTFEDIGESIGCSASEIERMVSSGADRYVRTQPALRTWVRNWISGKYTTMIEADWDQASDPDHPQKLEHQDRVMRMLVPLARLHGSEAPTQSEVKVEHAPEAVERLVQALATAQGQGYDMSVFDNNVVDADVVSDLVHDSVDETLAALEAASKEVEQPQPDDANWDEEL